VPQELPLSVAVAQIPVDPARARVHEEGWQSWSPSTDYGLTDRPLRPVSERNRLLCYRGDRVAPEEAFWGEGVLAVDPGDGSGVHVVAAADPLTSVPSIAAVRVGDSLAVSADGPVTHTVETTGDGVQEALARWADALVARLGLPAPRPAPTAWCSWYHYYTAVTEADVLDNVVAIDDLGLDVDVVQIDDGYQAEIGDWLSLSGRFESLERVVRAIHDRGRRAGIWVAPFLAGERSRLAAEHRDWLVPDAVPGHMWGQELHTLDVTHPGAAAYLHDVFRSLLDLGIDYFKIDFIYAGALDGQRHTDVDGISAYRQGLRLIREAIGTDAYLLGCGAPMLPSIGLVDAMRVGPDTDARYEPVDGDMSQPSVRAAMVTSRGRQWQHGRFWVNDPDCLVARPEVEHREEWAAQVEATGGLVATSDSLRTLDTWGLETTRRLLRGAKTAVTR